MNAAVIAISIHALLTESDAGTVQADYGDNISIHALLTESDAMKKPTNTRALEFLSTLSLRRATAHGGPIVQLNIYFYPRSPYGERLPLCQLSLQRLYFYPRSPYGERPGRLQIVYRGSFYFYPRSPYGERRNESSEDTNNGSISIHALLTESDPPGIVLRNDGILFLSTLSLRRAT